MIITRPKELSEVLEALKDHRRLAVVGCSLCGTTCRTGGEEEVREMTGTLTREGKEVVWSEVVDGPCHRLLARRTVKNAEPTDAILVMACGSGVQTVASLTESPVYPALDSLFLGSVLRAGSYEEKCSLCGNCMVGRFGGFCPVTLCSKNMLNGPCGGMDDGRCESDPEQECVWHKIYLVKEENGLLDDLEEIVPHRYHSNRFTP